MHALILIALSFQPINLTPKKPAPPCNVYTCGPVCPPTDPNGCGIYQ